ncbi:MAG: hypothetical protein IT368_05620, partial [Candidatus Hydrogenedentes bacterium]|nr:hypothetical protein [Candidatus Hydrogenedentota bacterium]
MMSHPKFVGLLSLVCAAALASPQPAGACSTCTTAGDGDGDCRVSLQDYRELNACLAGPGAAAPVECACYDMDGDGYVDLRDAAKFQAAFSGAEMLSACTLPTRAEEPRTLEKPFSILPAQPQASISDPAPSESVRAFSGEFHLEEVDLRVPGRGFDFVWGRTYRSRTGSSTAMGNGWSFAYDLHLQPLGGDILIHGDDGIADTYCARSGGTWSNPERFSDITQLPNGDYQ